MKTPAGSEKTNPIYAIGIKPNFRLCTPAQNPCSKRPTDDIIGWRDLKVLCENHLAGK